MIVLGKVVEKALNLYVFAWRLKCLHLYQLLNGVFHVEGLKRFLEVIGLYLCEVKQIIHEEMEDICWWI